MKNRFLINRIKLQLLIVTICFAGINVALAKSKTAKPNIIFFLADDQSIWDVGCYGNDVVKTPNIDRLAAEGMRFNRMFTTTAMCAPARSMLYTGLFPHRNGCYMNHGSTKQGIISLPTYLKPLGYRVVLAGKKHIHPKEIYPFEYIDQKDISKVINGREPYCLIIASNEPHSPHVKGNYNPKDIEMPAFLPDIPEMRNLLADYYADIKLVDKELGIALNLLKKSGKEQNTLFIYASDHGYGHMAKWSCYESGLRVPFIVRWPEKVKAASSSNAMLSFVDVLPTFLEAAGAEPPSNIDGISFINVLKGKTDESRSLIYGSHTNQGIISGLPYPIRSVRDFRYKYIRNLNPDGIPSNTITHIRDKEKEEGDWAQWKKAAKTNETAARLLKRTMHRPQDELYDLEKDPWELNNLASNSKYVNIKAELSKDLDKWMEQQGDKGMEAELKARVHKSLTDKNWKPGNY
ncbi:sulfatase family protein [Lutibacter citreus]|uniref:sulfatase family protein n=1 Tax=Lutibacter citreus TaxID=2138210 RepID=UPI000DBE32E4|nr:sulfatase [Lutibacter citreus]